MKKILLLFVLFISFLFVGCDKAEEKKSLDNENGKYELKEASYGDKTYNKETLLNSLGRTMSIKIKDDVVTLYVTYYDTDGNASDKTEKYSLNDNKLKDQDGNIAYDYKYSDKTVTIKSVEQEEELIFVKK